MTDAYDRPSDVLPPPGLFSAEIPNFGPVIDPPFIDVPDYSQYLVPPNSTPVESEPVEHWATDEMRRRAVELALASDAVTAALDGKRFEVLDVGTWSLDRQTDYLLVVAYDYTDDVVVEATIDPARGAVYETRLERYQPPLTDAELARALELVRADGRLTDAGTDVATGVGIIVEEVNARSPRHGRRLVDLRFGPADRYLPTAFAIVDLSGQEVVATGLIPQEATS